MSNLFYDLPEEIKHKIHKIVYTMEINPKINEYIPPGDFSFMITKESSGFDIYWFATLAEDYISINNLGPEAWEYLKNNTFSSWYIPTEDTPEIFHKISQCMSIEHSGASFVSSMSNMVHIAKVGWENYVKEYKLAFKQQQLIYS
jgi:hypothetical protein